MTREAVFICTENWWKGIAKQLRDLGNCARVENTTVLGSETVPLYKSDECRVAVIRVGRDDPGLIPHSRFCAVYQRDIHPKHFKYMERLARKHSVPLIAYPEQYVAFPVFTSYAYLIALTQQE